MRTLLDAGGLIETAKHIAELIISDERKIDQIVEVLKKYNVYLAGLQETKWFGAEMYKVGDSVALSSGRPVPTTRESHHKREGVALVLRGSAIQAWKAAGIVSGRHGAQD